MIQETETTNPIVKIYECRKQGALRHYKNNTEKCIEYSKNRYKEKKQDEEWLKIQREKNKIRMRLKRQQLKNTE